METLKDSEAASSSVHSRNTSQMDDTPTHNYDVENPSTLDNEKETKDPNIVDWDGPDDVSFNIAMVIICTHILT